MKILIKAQQPLTAQLVRMKVFHNLRTIQEVIEVHPLLHLRAVIRRQAHNLRDHLFVPYVANNVQPGQD